MEKSEILQTKLNNENIRIYDDYSNIRQQYFTREKKAFEISKVALKQERVISELKTF